MRTIVTVLAVALIASQLVGTAAAQQTTPLTDTPPPSETEAQQTPPLPEAPTVPEVTPVFNLSDFILSTRSIVLTRFLRFFTINPTKDAELTASIGNALLLTALRQQAAGETNRATNTLAKYERETELLRTLVETIQPQNTDPATSTFLTNLAIDRAVSMAALEATVPAPAVPGVQPTDLASKLIAAQAKVLRDIARSLEQETDPVERNKKLAAIFEHYAKKQAKLEAKLAKKMLLADRLDDETEDDALETDLDEQEDEALRDADELDEVQTTQLLIQLAAIDDRRRATILTKLLQRVPTEAKGGVEQAIDQLVSQELAEAGDDQEAINQLVDGHSRSAVVQEKILEKLKEHADEPTKQKLDAAKKQVEKQREAAKKIDEKKQEDSKQKQDESNDKDATKDDDDEAESDTKIKSGAAPTSTTTPSPAESTPSSRGSSGSSSTPVAAQKETIEIKVVDDGTFDKTSHSAERGAELTVKFKNETETSRTLTLSNGKSATVGKGETTISAFTFDAALTFTASGVSGSGTISVK